MLGRCTHCYWDYSGFQPEVFLSEARPTGMQALDALHHREDAALGGKPYFISDDAPVQLWPWLNALFERVGVPKVTKSISLAAAQKLGAAAEKTFRLLGVQKDPPMTPFVASQLATSHWYDMTPAKRDFDYTPVISMEEGLARLIDDINARGLAD